LGSGYAANERDLPLVTDDAWGLDYKLSGHPDLPEGALSRGSDLAIGSVHKTLTGLGQTSVISVGSDRIDLERLQLCHDIEKSTSASSSCSRASTARGDSSCATARHCSSAPSTAPS
jgi:arginine/lysine/ornithine decarboxylase